MVASRCRQITHSAWQPPDAQAIRHLYPGIRPIRPSRISERTPSPVPRTGPRGHCFTSRTRRERTPGQTRIHLIHSGTERHLPGELECAVARWPNANPQLLPPNTADHIPPKGNHQHPHQGPALRPRRVDRRSQARQRTERTSTRQERASLGRENRNPLRPRNRTGHPRRRIGTAFINANQRQQRFSSAAGHATSRPGLGFLSQPCSPPQNPQAFGSTRGRTWQDTDQDAVLG